MAQEEPDLDARRVTSLVACVVLRAHAQRADRRPTRQAVRAALQDGSGSDAQVASGVLSLWPNKHQASVEDVPAVCIEVWCPSGTPLMLVSGEQYFTCRCPTGETSLQWQRVRRLSSPDWQAPLWVAASCLRLAAERCDGEWSAAPGEMQLLMGCFAAAAAAIPDSDGHAALLDLALQVPFR